MPKRGLKYGRGASRSINETMLVCRVIGNVHTVGSVYWCVVCGEYELGEQKYSFLKMTSFEVHVHVHVYADGGSYSCVCWECTLMLGVKNVIWCVGRVI